ncbi:MAG: hypothetical protein H7834_05960 [Magnetococcus sp. YQC-9]
MRTVLIFLLFFLLVSVGIRQGLEMVGFQPYIGLISEKLDHLERNHDQVDIVFLGASDYGAAIDPVELDAAMAASGCQERSFNFGIDGLNAVEFRWLMEQLQAKFANKLPRLIIGIPSHNYQLSEGRSTRTQFFLNFSNLYYYLYDIWNLPRQKMARARMLMDLALKYGREAGQGGELYEWLFDGQRGSSDNSARIARIDARRGYLADATVNTPQELQQLAERVGQIVQEVDTQYRSDYYDRLYGEGTQRRMTPLIDTARRLGFDVGVLFGPSLSHYLASATVQRHLRGAYPEIPVWHYNDPKQWPELFDAANLANATHLNASGAKAFSQRLAPDLCAWVRGRRVPVTSGVELSSS